MPYRSPFPVFELPSVDLPGLFFDSRKSNSKNSTPFPHDQIITTLAETGESLTYDQIRQLSGSFARGLKTKIGLKRGDAICIYSTNHVLPFLVGADCRYTGIHC
jgi:4-coumarate--CoA ligase